MNKKIQSLIALVILLGAVGFLAYYYWPKSGVPVEENNLFEFKVVDQNLADWQKKEYQERFDKAVSSLNENPDQLDGWLELGMIKKHLGDYKGAEAAWFKAGEYRPSNSISFNNLADLYINFTKEYDKVEPVIRKAIENSMGEEKNAMFYRNFFSFYLDNLKDPKKAEEILLEGIKNNPRSDLMALLANFYQSQGRTEEAIDYYRQHLEIYPDDEIVKQEIQKLIR
ncbi:MAG: tetratricopeptide repeat protein [Patescibacteria group bacterium]|jgi:tetratricopeptide (TPR) repeat protein